MIKPYGGTGKKKKKGFFHPSSLYQLVHFQGLRPDFVLFPFCCCLNTGGVEPTAASHEPITQQRMQHALFVLTVFPLTPAGA